MKILWLFGEEDYVTEVGAMNIFFLLEKEGGGGVELVTSPLDAGDILDGEAASSLRLLLNRTFRCRFPLVCSSSLLLRLLSFVSCLIIEY